MKENPFYFLVPFVASLSIFTACDNNETPVPNSLLDNAATITDFSPQTAFIGDTVILTGKNLSTGPQSLVVNFGNVRATILKTSETSAQVIVPDDIETSSVKIQLLSTAGIVSPSKDFKLKAPVIQSISPTTGYAGQKITIKGKGFSKSPLQKQIKFGDKPVSAVDPDHSTLTLYVPDGTPVGAYTISVAVAGLTTTATESFHVVVPAVPSIASFSPQTAFIGDVVTITGENLGTDPDKLTIRFGNADATVIGAAGTSARVIVPADIEASSVKIYLSVPGGADLTPADNFTVKAPVIESISHTRGFGGQRITIKGKGFRNSYHFDQVEFGSTVIDKSTVNFTGTTELLFSVPNHAAAGKYTITVDILGMTAMAADQFEVIVPTLTSFTPETGSQYTAMTITGTNLKDINGGTTSVFFRDKQTGLQLTTGLITFLTDTEIKVIVPSLVKDRPQGWTVSVSVVSSTVVAANVFNYTE